MSEGLATLAVDLTPILPGGENGGAKIFVLELLRGLAKVMPRTQFLLLTHFASHEELAVLDGPNMRRVMIIGPAVGRVRLSRISALLSRAALRLPAGARDLASRVHHRVGGVLKRTRSSDLFHRLHVDLLFCPFTAPTFFEPGIPAVCTLYDLQYKAYPEFFTPEDVAHREGAFLEACRRATALAAISNFSRDAAIATGYIEPARIQTVYLRMAQRFVPGARAGEGTLERIGLNGQRYLFYPANFWKHKNHEMLLTAFGIACRQGLANDIKLVCTGAPGARQTWLAEAARAMGLQQRVAFPGFLPDNELGILLTNAYGLVFPSLYEGFGLPVIEAMSAGIPVACSNTTSLPEVASDAALLFDPRVPTEIAQAMISLTEDEILRARLTSAGKLRAQEFSDSTRMAMEYRDLFLYAVSNQRLENDLSGAHADGWAGRSLKLLVAPADGPRTVEVEFFAPEWLPKPHFTVRATSRGKLHGVPLEFNRGASAVMSMQVEPEGGYFELAIAPIFVPSLFGLGEDPRELSVMLRRCSILNGKIDRVELLPQGQGVPA